MAATEKVTPAPTGARPSRLVFAALGRRTCLSRWSSGARRQLGSVATVAISDADRVHDLQRSDVGRAWAGFSLWQLPGHRPGGCPAWQRSGGSHRRPHDHRGLGPLAGGSPLLLEQPDQLHVVSAPRRLVLQSHGRRSGRCYPGPGFYLLVFATFMVALRSTSCSRSVIAATSNAACSSPGWLR